LGPLANASSAGASRSKTSGWTARLTYDDEAVVYCPGCDEREFGERLRRK
jgi:hypothetical protein